MYHTVEVIKLLLMMLAGGMIMGYLLTSWSQEIMIERQGRTIDDLVCQIENLEAHIVCLEAGMSEINN